MLWETTHLARCSRRYPASQCAVCGRVRFRGDSLLRPRAYCLCPEAPGCVAPGCSQRKWGDLPCFPVRPRMEHQSTYPKIPLWCSKIRHHYLALGARYPGTVISKRSQQDRQQAVLSELLQSTRIVRHLGRAAIKGVTLPLRCKQLLLEAALDPLVGDYHV